MTVSYNQDVASERIGGFFRLLFRWRGSIYHAVYGEIGIFLTLFFVLNFIYRFALNEPQKTTFERLCLYCEKFIDFIPVTFILGFYLVRVISRRWAIWENMPFPDRFSLDISSYFQGTDVRSRILRRALVRYVNLGSVLCIRDICVPVRKRFPTLDHLIIAGFLTCEEMDLFKKSSNTKDSNWWIPFQWAYTLLTRCCKEGRISEGGMMRLHDGVMDLRNKCWVMFSYDWIPIPMVYTQVCTLSVYLFMTASLFGRQYLDPVKNYPNHNTDLYFPFFTLFQITFYLGWLKVSEVLINPMGYDADDFDMNYVVDRNVRVAYTMVDDNFNRMPPVEKDIFWGVEEPAVPHTEASKGVRDTPFVGSATTMKVTEQEAQPAIAEEAKEIPPLERKLSTASNALRRLLHRGQNHSSDSGSRSDMPDSRQALLDIINESDEEAAASRHATNDSRATLSTIADPQRQFVRRITVPRYIEKERNLSSRVKSAVN